VGKTAVCAALGKHLISDGKKTGFFKPILGGNKPAGADPDATFMKQLLGLKEAAETLCPFLGGEGNVASRISQSLSHIAPGKDVILAEGVNGQPSPEVAKALGARVIIVEAYSPGLPREELVAAAKSFGEQLLGVVINRVPVSQAERVRAEAPAWFSSAGISLLGVLPEDRALASLTIGELAEQVRGEIVNNPEKSPELAENVMLGALTVDSGLLYFGRKPNKVAVLRSDRPDMHLAALETSTRALVISGGTELIPSVRHRAEDKGIPLILTSEDVPSIVALIEDALAKVRFNQESKVPRMSQIMAEHFAWGKLYQALGLAS